MAERRILNSASLLARSDVGRTLGTLIRQHRGDGRLPAPSTPNHHASPHRILRPVKLPPAGSRSGCRTGEGLRGRRRRTDRVEWRRLRDQRRREARLFQAGEREVPRLPGDPDRHLDDLGIRATDDVSRCRQGGCESVALVRRMPARYATSAPAGRTVVESPGLGAQDELRRRRELRHGGRGELSRGDAWQAERRVRWRGGRSRRWLLPQSEEEQAGDEDEQNCRGRGRSRPTATDRALGCHETEVGERC